MPKEKAKIISIVGPTASGKSDLAVKIAKAFNGEIISADSRQVYSGLDIGSGKITKKEMMGIPHHLLNVCNPKKVFTVSNFQIEANKAILDILQRGKLPILCGGTGFYIDSVVKNIIFPDVPPNPDLRSKIKDFSLDKLQKMLLKLDPKRYKTIDTQNKVRLIRAIEIAKALGRVPKIKSKPLYNSLTIGTLLEPDTIKSKIEKRLKKRLDVGMVAEVKNLHKKGLSWKRLESLGLEYRYVALFLQKKISKEEMIDNLNKEIWQYAKRQMTWFQKDKEIVWMDPKQVKEIKSKIKKFL